MFTTHTCELDIDFLQRARMRSILIRSVGCCVCYLEDFSEDYCLPSITTLKLICTSTCRFQKRKWTTRLGNNAIFIRKLKDIVHLHLNILKKDVFQLLMTVVIANIDNLDKLRKLTMRFTSCSTDFCNDFESLFSRVGHHLCELNLSNKSYQDKIRTLPCEVLNSIASYCTSLRSLSLDWISVNTIDAMDQRKCFYHQSTFGEC